jgi:hypothetical protein
MLGGLHGSTHRFGDGTADTLVIYVYAHTGGCCIAAALPGVLRHAAVVAVGWGSLLSCLLWALPALRNSE